MDTIRREEDKKGARPNGVVEDFNGERHDEQRHFGAAVATSDEFYWPRHPLMIMSLLNVLRRRKSLVGGDRVRNKSLEFHFQNMKGLPFHVGQVVESRSFQAGYRGAWFRCKIQQIRKKNNHVIHTYEYLDYPDQEVLRIKIFQRPPAGFCESRKRQLMVRPRFPMIYHESEKPDVSTISEVIVIVHNAWKMGDLVDWWTEGCYWSGRVTEILDDGKLKIDLLLPPFGEGPSSHEVSSEDLRPSLNWCLDNGWTVPTPLEGGSRRPCAQIIMPVVNSVAGVVVNKNSADGAAKTVPRVSLISDSSQSTQNSESPTEISMKVKNHCNTASNSMEFGIGDTSSGKTCSESSHVREASTEMVVETAVNDGYDDNYTLKKMRSNKSICLNSMSSNTMEAAILDLEELVNRIKWIKGVMEFGMSLSANKQPSWEIFQHHPPCTEK